MIPLAAAGAVLAPVGQALGEKLVALTFGRDDAVRTALQFYLGLAISRGARSMPEIEASVTELRTWVEAEVLRLVPPVIAPQGELPGGFEEEKRG